MTLLFSSSNLECLKSYSVFGECRESHSRTTHSCCQSTVFSYVVTTSRDALASFDWSVITHGINDNLNFVTCTNKLIVHVLLQQVYLEQKHYMRHIIKKPRNCSAQEFVTRLFKINQYLDWFLPFNANKKLSTNKLLDIAGFTIPTAWKNTMCLHVLDPLAHNKDEFIEFCQWCKFIEWPPPYQQWSEYNNNGNGQVWLRDHPQDHNTNQNCMAKHKTTKDDDNDGKPKWCEYHQNSTHNTGTC